MLLLVNSLFALLYPSAHTISTNIHILSPQTSTNSIKTDLDYTKHDTQRERGREGGRECIYLLIESCRVRSSVEGGRERVYIPAD